MPTSELASPDASAPAGLVDVSGRPFPLQGARIRAHAEGGVARTVFEQRYENPYDEPLEVLYTLPLPADGAVIGYTIHLGDRRIVGEIQTREAAREQYEKALEEGRTAGLLEQERADTFTQCLGSLPPGEPVRVEIEVLHPLAFRAVLNRAGVELETDTEALSGGPATPHWEYRFPTVVGVRYEGAPERVADAGKLDVDRAAGSGTPARLEVELTIADGAPDALHAFSSTHRIRLEPARETDAAARLTLDEPSRLDRDLVVHWLATSDEVGVRLVEGSGLEGDDGRYALLTITPPTRPETTFARDLTVLIDASGSMDGHPIERAKDVVEQLLATLGPLDRFELLSFDMGVERFHREPTEATPRNVRRALEWLRGLRAGGGTEMTSAVYEALEPLRSDSQRQVVLVTDGYIGFESEVVGRIRRQLPEGARLHTVGIGTAPNRTLTRDAARAGRGVELLVSDTQHVPDIVDHLLRATNAPVLTDLEIAGSAVKAPAPAHPRDVTAAEPRTIVVELIRRAGQVEVTGRMAGHDRPCVWSVDVPSSATAATSLPIGALFGREAIADLELDLTTEGIHGAARILDRIEKMGLRHRITSRRTSLVAVAEEPTVDPRDPRRRERLPVELPAEISAEGVGLVGGDMRLGVTEARMMTASKAMARHLRGAVSADIAPPDMMDEAPYEAPPRRSGIRRLLSQLRDTLSRVDRRMLKAFIDRRRAVPIVARCVRAAGTEMVIEFEVPRDDFRLPGDDLAIRVTLEDDRELEARIVTERSTRPGVHPAGVTLRLTLLTTDSSDWPSGASALLEWEVTPEMLSKCLPDPDTLLPVPLETIKVEIS